MWPSRDYWLKENRIGARQRFFYTAYWLAFVFSMVAAVLSYLYLHKYAAPLVAGPVFYLAFKLLLGIYEQGHVGVYHSS